VVRRKRAFVALALGISFPVVACQVVAGIERVEKVPFVPADASPVDAGGDADTDTGIPDPCAHSRPSGRPPVDDDPTTELPMFVVALSSFQMTGLSDAGTPAFDLDGVCTCDDRPGAARGGASACKSTRSPACDLDGGGDNQAVSAFDLLASLSPENPLANTNERIGGGRQTLLVFIRRYNGKANDLEVEVGLALSEGIFTQGCPSSVLDPTDMRWSAGWCGSDPWTISSVGTTAGLPTTFSTGHVSDYRLVVELDRGVELPIGESPLVLGSPLAAAKLVPLGEDLKPRDPTRPTTELEKRLWRLDEGVLAGRLAATDLLAGLGMLLGPEVDDAGRRIPICRLSMYTLVKVQICDNVDIAKSNRLDNQPDYPCDAVSTAIGFTGLPSVTGGPYTEPLGDNPCTPVDGGPRDPSPYVKRYSCSGF